MTIVDRLENALYERKLYKNAAAKYIGVAATTLQSWKISGDFPARHVVPLSQFLGVSPIWLLTGEDVMPPEIPEDYHQLTADEWFLVQTLRGLDKAGQILVASKAVEEKRRCTAEQGNEGVAAG